MFLADARQPRNGLQIIDGHYLMLNAAQLVRKRLAAAY